MSLKIFSKFWQYLSDYCHCTIVDLNYFSSHRILLVFVSIKDCPYLWHHFFFYYCLCLTWLRIVFNCKFSKPDLPGTNLMELTAFITWPTQISVNATANINIPELGCYFRLKVGSAWFRTDFFLICCRCDSKFTPLVSTTLFYHTSAVPFVATNGIFSKFLYLSA